MLPIMLLPAGAAGQSPPGLAPERQVTIGRPAGEVARFAPAATDMVWAPPGSFTMGCVAGDGECFDDERPPRLVSFAHGFWIDANEVTVESFRAFATATGHTLPPPASFPQARTHPVVNVSWADASAYCAWAGGRLPHESEWEYAARGGIEGLRYPWGHLLSRDHANWEGVEGHDRFAKTAPVGSFERSAWGLADIAGNVWEWCADIYRPSVAAASDGDARGGELRVMRGGSFAHPPRSLRASNRGKFAQAGRLEMVGFRCVREEGVVPAGTAPAGAAPAPSSMPSIQPRATAAAADTTFAAPLDETAAPATSRPPASTPPAALGARQSFPPANAEMVRIPGGTFEMGAVRGDGAGFADEQPRRSVTLTSSFWIDVSEVTVAAYRRFVEATGARLPAVPNWAGDDHPVVNVDWDEAAAYCAWAGGRLPSEAEWERAARGGEEGTKYPWGNDISHDEANFDGTGGRDEWAKSSPIGAFPANGWGLVDTAGNAWEWCADWYEERYYARAPAVDPKGPESGRARVVRGGCWTSDPGRLRSSYRFNLDPSTRQVSVGFRCVREE